MSRYSKENMAFAEELNALIKKYLSKNEHNREHIVDVLHIALLDTTLEEISYSVEYRTHNDDSRVFHAGDDRKKARDAARRASLRYGSSMIVVSKNVKDFTGQVSNRAVDYHYYEGGKETSIDAPSLPPQEL